MKYVLFALATLGIFGQELTADEVRSVVEHAASSAKARRGVAISVTNRRGDILAVFRTPNAPDTAIGNFSASVDTNELAVALARTAAFFSNNQAPLSSRTVRFISGVHFPPGISFHAFERGSVRNRKHKSRLWV